PNNKECCPDPVNGILGCCDLSNYIVDKVKAKYDPVKRVRRYSSDVLKDLTRRFTKWVDPVFSCERSTPLSPVTDQLGFCKSFARTVRFVWQEFTKQDAQGAKLCAPLVQTPQAFNECIT